MFARLGGVVAKGQVAKKLEGASSKLPLEVASGDVQTDGANYTQLDPRFGHGKPFCE
jgi:hypothetical protein